MTKAGPVIADRLRSLIERIERLKEEQKALASDVRDIFSEAKGIGYDVKTMRKVIALRAMDAADRAEDVHRHDDGQERRDPADADLAQVSTRFGLAQ